jgi:hypothetical protein
MWCEFWITRVKRKSKRIRNTSVKKTNVKTNKKKTTDDKRYSSNVKIRGGIHTVLRNISRKFPSFSIAVCDFKISLNFKNEPWHLQYMKVRIFNRSYSMLGRVPRSVGPNMGSVNIRPWSDIQSVCTTALHWCTPPIFTVCTLDERLTCVSNYRLFKHRLFTACLRLSL